MRLLTLSLVCLVGVQALAQTGVAPSDAAAPKRAGTALGGLKLLPPGQAANLVSIFAREGCPAPERWYFLTYDAKAQNGVAEFVVSNQKLVVAARNLSQFAERLRPEDVAGALNLKIDSDKAGQIAQDYARANSLSIGSIDYTLKKEDSGSLVWNLGCLDSANQPMGELKIAASNGSVLSHPGFALEPAATPAPTPLSSPTPKPGQSVVSKSSRPSPTPKKKKSEDLGSKLKHFFTGH
jgi:hypothetical protein